MIKTKTTIEQGQNCNVSEALRLNEKGGITLFYGDYRALSSLAECLACHAALSSNAQTLLEIVDHDKDDKPDYLKDAPANLEVFIADTSHGVALVHAATTMACSNEELAIFSTLAPSLYEDWLESNEERLAWQLIRDEAFAIYKSVGIFLFSSANRRNLSHQEMSYANNVIRVSHDGNGWLLEYVKTDSRNLRRKKFFLEEPVEIASLRCTEVK